MYALVSKVNNISWNCLRDIQNVCGDDKLTTEETNERLIVAATMTWVEVLAFLVLLEMLLTELFSELLLFVVLLVVFKTQEFVVFIPDEIVIVLLLKTYPSFHLV